MQVHKLKIKPKYFNDVISNKKRFEVRLNDRNFEIGDLIVLEEFKDDRYTNRFINCEITYILDDQEYLKENYVILGFKTRLEIGAVIL